MRKLRERVVSITLALTMVLTTFSGTGIAYALETTEHTHNDICGYVESVEGHSCEHEHDETCGYTSGTEEVPCDMDCTDEDNDGVIDHADGCAYTPAAEGTACDHVHDETCGYAEAIEGQPCMIQPVIDAIEAAADAVTNHADNASELVSAARSRYDALNEAQQEEVCNYQDLVDAEASLAESSDEQGDSSLDIDIDTDSAAGIEYSNSQESQVMALLNMQGETPRNSQEENGWRFKLYYVKYASALATEKNDTVLHLIGNSEPTTQPVKYQLEFHNDTDYEIGEVRIRIPYALYQDRHGTEVIPSDIGVPMAPAESKICAFNYTLETIDDEQYIVFTNTKKLISGSNNLIQVFYLLNDLKTIDGTSWTLSANISVCGESTDSDIILRGSMDTETELKLTKKNAYSRMGSSIYPEVYTWNQVMQWSNLSGEQPDWFDDYRYVLWETEIRGRANQVWDLTVTDTPDCDGEVIAQTVYDYGKDYRIAGPFEGSEFTLSGCERYTLSPGTTSTSGERIYVYSLVRYPIASFPENCKVSNHIQVTLTGVDDQIEHTLSSDAAHVWEDYNWHYEGDLFGIIKYYEADNTEEAWLDAYEYAVSQGADLALPNAWELHGIGRGYSFVANDPDASYTLCVIDDLQYIRSNTGNYTLLTPDDYYYSNIRFENQDYDIDIYEDQEIPLDDGTPFLVYVMTADRRDTWQLVDTVDFEDFHTYQIPQSYYDSGIYRIKVEHSVNCYETNIYISGTTVLRADSELINGLLDDGTASKLFIMNTAAAYGIDPNGDQMYADDGYGSGPLRDEFIAFDLREYGGYVVRSSDVVSLTRLQGMNDAVKYVTEQNNPADARVDLNYTLMAYDGYTVYNASAVDLFKELGISVARDQVVFYDLLPLGVVFNASKPVKAGNLPQRYTSDPKSWNSKEVAVDWAVQDDYRGSGRQMVVFTLTYTGDGTNDSVSKVVSTSYDWYCGWGLNFSAYYSWEDYSVASTGINVMAFATDTPIRGRGYLDDGTGVPTAAGVDENGRSYFYDPENDGLANEPYLIYATATNGADIAVASKGTIEKFVAEDTDIYGAPSIDARVALGNTYTYTIQVSNASGTLKDIIVFDQLENAVAWHSDMDSRIFESEYWRGTFCGVDLTKAIAHGADPVVYYSENRDQGYDLTAEGWILASDWQLDLSEVKSVAVDLQHTPTGGDFELVDIDSVQIEIKMRAPEEMRAPANYAYNSSAFHSVSIAAEGSESFESTVLGNSTSVSLYELATLTVEKQLAGTDVPVDESFIFTVEIAGAPYADKEYVLLSAEGERLPGVHATDINGKLSLKGGQRAVFTAVPLNAEYTVTEESSVNWITTPENGSSGVLTGDSSALFINRYASALYFEKKIEYAQDYTNGNEDLFRFRLLLDGEQAAGVPYSIVDASVPVNREATIIQSGLVTDSEGCFTLKAGQRVLFKVLDGTEYRFEEIEMPDDYTCSNPTASGTVDGRYALASVTNQYRYKDLYVTKTVEKLDGVTVNPDAVFDFTVKIDGQVGAFPYIRYELQTDAETSETRYVETERGTTLADGAFSLKDGQQIRLIRLPAGASYEVTELENDSDLFKPYNPANGVLTGTLPKYAPYKETEFVNRSLLRPLEISKNVISSRAVNDVAFTFTLSINGQAYGGMPYTIIESGKPDVNAVTDSNGAFTLTCTQKAVFADLCAGDEYVVHETPLEGFTQTSPATGEDFVGIVKDGWEATSVQFVNVDDMAPNMLVIRKNLVSDIPGAVEASKYDVRFTGSYPNFTPVFTYGKGISYIFRLEVDGVPYTGPFTRISADGTTTVETPYADTSLSWGNVHYAGEFELYATDTIIITGLTEGQTYSLTERQHDDANNIWERTTLYDPATGEELPGCSIVKASQVYPENGQPVEGAIGRETSYAEITNKLIGYAFLNIEKAIDGDNVWSDNSAENKEWGEVKGKIWFRLQLRDADGNIVTGPETYLFMQYGGDYDEICTPDANGYFYMTIDNTTIDESGRISEYYGEVDGYIPYGYDIKLEEIRTEPENLFGKLTGIYNYDNFPLDDDGFYQTSNETSLYFAFSNTTDDEAMPYRVYKELGNTDSGDNSDDFSFTLYQSDPFEMYRGQLPNGRWDDFVKDLTYSVLPDEPYSLYETSSNKYLGQYYTDANGQFTLKAGQYAQFIGLRQTYMDGYYDFGVEECQPHYRIVETPYSNYVPQVTVDLDGTGTEIISLGNVGTVIGGGHIVFQNAFEQSSSLVVTKTVTSTAGVSVPANDEFVFTLTVEGKAYGNEEYLLYGSDGQQLVNVQTINGYTVELPWTTDKYGEFTLKAGQRAVFAWVGEGKTYEITESPKTGYVQVAPAGGLSIKDVITADGSTAAFVNHYAGNQTSGTIQVNKVIALPHGIVDAPDETFDFQITIDGDPYGMESYSLYRTDGTLLNSNMNTDYDGKFSLAGDQYAVFKNVKSGSDYEICELLPDGSAYRLINSQNASGATSASGVIATFTNAYGNLVVSKQVESALGSTAPTDDVFTFRIKVDGQAYAQKSYQKYDLLGNLTGEGVTQADGSFELKDGEMALFNGIPRGSAYSVEEDGKRYYTQKIPGDKEGYSGIITDTAEKLVFLNEYSRLAALEITKQVVDSNGNPHSSDDVFTFKVTVGRNAYANKAYTVYGADGYKKAGVYSTSDTGTLTLLAGECAVFTGLIPGINYTVEEINIPDGYTTAEAVKTGSLDMTGSAADFINICPEEQPETGNLIVSKSVTGSGADAANEFTFTVTLSDTSIRGTYGDMTFTDGIATFTLKANERKAATGLPAGVTYTVSESDNSGYTVTVNNTDATTANGTILKDETAVAAFNNHKDSGGEGNVGGGSGTSPAPAKVTIRAEKTLDGQVPAGSSFTFVLKDQDGNVMQTANNVSGNIDFKSLSFSKAGTYVYTISESAGTDSAIYYDNTVYTVRIRVTKSGDYTATVSYEKGGQTYDGTPTFANTTKSGTDPVNPVNPTVPDTPTDPTVPTDPDTPVDPSKSTDSDVSAIPGVSDRPMDDVPRTGDTSYTGLWLIIMLASITGMAVCLFVKRRTVRRAK